MFLHIQLQGKIIHTINYPEDTSKRMFTTTSAADIQYLELKSSQTSLSKNSSIIISVKLDGAVIAAPNSY